MSDRARIAALVAAVASAAVAGVTIFTPIATSKAPTSPNGYGSFFSPVRPTLGRGSAGPNHSYRGQVFLGPGKVRLRFTVGQDYVYDIHSGKIPLICTRGTATTRIAPGPVIRKKPPHRRAFGITVSGQESNGYKLKIHFGGTLDKRHARGHFRYRFRKPSGKVCGTGGRLVWTAHRR
jgi:hypothetical protein